METLTPLSAAPSAPPANGARAPRAADCTRVSASALAALIATGDLSAVEVVEAHIAQIERVNPGLNAVVVKRYAAARAEAAAADAARARGVPCGPLHGVPVTIKESLDLADTPSTFGLPARAASRAPGDDRYVARLRAAGAIVLGKTNVAQALLYFESDNPVYGRSNNPWNPARAPGGSSGGQAAIIAAGGVPLGLGTDVGGSIRVPATSCGIAGFKPTAGRTPDDGRYSLPIGQRAIVSQVGVLARHVADVALGLQVIAAAPHPAGPPVPSIGDPATVDLRGLRVAYYTDDGTFAVAPAVARAVGEAAALLRAGGATVTAWTPPAVSEAVDLFLGIFSADGLRGVARLTRGGPRDPRITNLLGICQRSRPTLAMLTTVLRAVGQPGLAGALPNFGYTDAAHYWDLVAAQMDYQQRFLAALDAATGGPFDVILCPACALPALTHGSSRDLTNIGGYTVLYNVLGYPTGIVPLTRVRPDEAAGRAPTRDRVAAAARQVEQGSAGLPVGVQVVARPWRDHVALAVMQALETAAAPRPDFPTTPIEGR